MADICTCGTQLPPNARFCHICGKPQREEDVPKYEPAVVPEAVPPAPAAAPDPTFRNGAAVRIGVLSALVSLVLSVLVPLPAFAPTVGGFFSIYLYRRRTGQTVNALTGARMGWITGIILFAMMACMLALVLMTLSSFPGGPQGLAAQMQHAPIPIQKEMIDEFVQFLQNPSKILLLLAGAFLMINLSTVAGGAIGGKLVGRAGSHPGRL